MSKKPLGIYIDLDTLLDTRIGTLFRLNPDVAISTIDSSDYYSRLTDEFKDIDIDEYRSLYEKRDIDTLKHSTITNILFILKEFIADTLKSVIDHPVYERIVLYVNTHPYEISNRDTNELIDVLQQHTFNSCEISIINKPLKDIDCLWVHTNVSHLFIYHYNEWLNLRGKELAHKGLPYTSLYCPRIYPSHIPTEEENKEFNEIKGDMEMDQFSFFVELYKYMIQINFLPIDLFSIVNTYHEDQLSNITRLEDD